jgi:cytochrome c oxidase subunit III
MSTEASSQSQVDVASLPRHALGPRAPIFWGSALLILIESTTFAILFISYFYIRNNFQEWPPDERLRLLPGVASAAVLLATVPPTWLYRRAAFAHRFRTMRAWLVVATLLSFASIAVRVWEIRAVPFLWTGSAYTSLVWTSLGLHTIEIVTGAVESAFMCVVLFRSRVELKTFEDVEAGALFWFFSVFVWLPFAAARTMNPRSLASRGMILGGGAALATQIVSYALVYPAAKWQSKTPVVIALLGGAGVAVVAVMLSVWALRRSRLESERFLSLLAIVLNAFFLFIVLVGFGVPALFLGARD